MSQLNPELSKLFVVIKQRLKAKSLTYRDVAQALCSTEISVKRWLAENRLTVKQLAAIAGLLGMSITELIKEAEEPPARYMTLEQETALVRDIRLLLVARCVLDDMSISEITKYYAMTEAECIHCLVRLDRLGIIDLMPNNQVNKRVSRHFDYLPDGPLQRFVLECAFKDLIPKHLAGRYQDMTVINASLTPIASKKLQGCLRRLRRQLAELHEESCQAPVDVRQNFATVVLQQEWDMPEYIALRR